ncbi:MAG: DUF3071 domain-containing protein [Aquiluna sp.]|nr:DUF3071 domain-containing protein [Aquiluna sp.]MCF8545130.1 DUF3071 domain-containing protein [Aquiluna sp.]
MELKFVSKESDYLVFETNEGQRLRAILDNTLRDAIRKVDAKDTSGLSPKDIQTLIRQGEGVESVAARYGVPVQAIEPFAAPILDELNFVLQAALTTKVSDGQTMLTFEDLVLRQFPAANFKAYKSGDQWVVSVDTDPELSWDFSPKHRILDPISPAAKKLTATPISPRDTVTANTGLRPVASENLTSKPLETEDADQEEPKASVHDLVEELRSRRQAETDVKPQPAKGRASLPSWDEIVLGTGHLETDPD